MNAPNEDREQLNMPGGSDTPANLEDFRSFMDAFAPILRQLLQGPQKILTAAPTFVPRNTLEAIQYHKSGSTYYLDMYVDGAWRSIATPTSTPSVGSLTQAVNGFMSSPASASHNFGFTPRFAIGVWKYSSTPNYWGFWVNGFESISMPIGNRADVYPSTFAAAGSSAYLSSLSASGTSLNYVYYNTGGTNAAVDMIVVGW